MDQKRSDMTTSATFL